MVSKILCCVVQVTCEVKSARGARGSRVRGVGEVRGM